MIYLNLNYKNAGLIFNEEIHYSDIKIEEKIDIDLIKDIFKTYRILKPLFLSQAQIVNGIINEDFRKERTKGCKFKLTIINIYKNKNNIK